MQQNTDQIPNPVSLTHEQNSTVQSKPVAKSGSVVGKIFNKWTLGFLVVILVLVVGGGLFLWPKAQTVKFASSTRESISGLFTQMDAVNSSLKSLYSYATQSDDGDVKLTKLLDTFENYISVFTAITGVEASKKEEPNNTLRGRLVNFFGDLEGLIENLEISKEGRVTFGEKVKGFTTPADDPNKIYRDQRDLAMKVISTTETSEEELKKLEGNLGKTPDSLSSLNNDLSNLKASAKEYLSESKKTADYYVLISELSIELEGSFESFAMALGSANSVNSLVASYDGLTRDLKKLQKELERVDAEKLPQGIEDVHNDNLKVFEISIYFFDQMKVLTLNNDEKGMTNLYTQTELKLSQLILSGTDHEISFWKNNKVLNSYEGISKRHTETLKKLEQERDNNNFFLLRWIGIK